MRHRKKFNHLGRTTAHRKAMLSNMAISLITHKRIHTTLAKAKALRIYVEPLITKSKEDTTHSRRTAFASLKDKTAVSTLFREVSEKVAQRPGGYTRIIKTGFRLGDNAQMCFIELVDFNENMMDAGTAKKTSRSRRGSKKKPAEAKAPEAKVSKEAKADVAEEKVAKKAKPAVKEEPKENKAVVVTADEKAEEVAVEAPVEAVKTETETEAKKVSEDKPETDESEKEDLK